MSINPHWQNGFSHEVFRDALSERWWFRLELVSEVDSMTFESEVVYSTREDAEAAAADASAVAVQYQATLWKLAP